MTKAADRVLDAAARWGDAMTLLEQMPSVNETYRAHALNVVAPAFRDLTQSARAYAAEQRARPRPEATTSEDQAA